MSLVKKLKIFKCLICKFPVTNKQKSICCDNCDNLIHLSCSKISMKHFNFLSKNKEENFYCKFCTLYSCGKCDKPVFNHHKALLCESSCGKWFHIKCINVSVASYKSLGKSSLPWFCLGCFTPPFHSLDKQKLESIFGLSSMEKITKKEILKQPLQTNCSVCSRKINKSKIYKALPCLSCSSLVN